MIKITNLRHPYIFTVDCQLWFILVIINNVISFNKKNLILEIVKFIDTFKNLYNINKKPILLLIRFKINLLLNGFYLFKKLYRSTIIVYLRFSVILDTLYTCGLACTSSYGSRIRFAFDRDSNAFRS